MTGVPANDMADMIYTAITEAVVAVKPHKDQPQAEGLLAADITLEKIDAAVGGFGSKLLRTDAISTGVVGREPHL